MYVGAHRAASFDHLDREIVGWSVFPEAVTASGDVPRGVRIEDEIDFGPPLNFNCQN